LILLYDTPVTVTCTHPSCGQAYRSTVRIRNDSHVPQKIGFVELPSVIDVQPNDGFVTLLPLVRNPCVAVP
jgi:hypothetical protein